MLQGKTEQTALKYCNYREISLKKITKMSVMNSLQAACLHPVGRKVKIA